jgi:hypothetical protein
MFLIKGVALGLAIFAAFSVLYLWAWGMLPISSNKAIGLVALRALTVQNTLYWITAVLMLALGCVIMAMWPVKIS